APGAWGEAVPPSPGALLGVVSEGGAERQGALVGLVEREVVGGRQGAPRSRQRAGQDVQAAGVVLLGAVAVLGAEREFGRQAEQIEVAGQVEARRIGLGLRQAGGRAQIDEVIVLRVQDRKSVV